MMSPMALRRTISRLLNRGVTAGGKTELVILAAAPLVYPHHPVSDPPRPIRAGSRFWRPQPRVDNLRGGVIFWITNDDDAAATGFDYIVLGDALRRVVGAFGMKIRTDLANDGAHVFFWEDNDGVHIRQRRQNFRAL